MVARLKVPLWKSSLELLATLSVGRGMVPIDLLSGLGAELRQTLRYLRRRPLWAGTIVLVLGLGLGANTAMFAAFEAWVLRPLDFREPETLVSIFETQLRSGIRTAVSPRNLIDVATLETGFESVGSYRHAIFNFEGLDVPERIPGALVSHELFPMLGAQPILGRTPSPDEDQPGRPAAVVLISERLWRERFGQDPGVLGREVRIDSRPHVVIGVMEKGFRFPEWAELWTPMGLDPETAARDERWLSVIGRLAPSRDFETVQRRIQAASASLEKQYPESNTGWGVLIEPLRRRWVPPVIETALTASMLSGLAVLLVVCANVANLLLAQASSRRFELALRSALGAVRAQLVRQQVMLCLLLSVLGGAAGIVLGYFWLEWMMGWAPIEPPYLFVMRLDLRAALFTFGLSLVAGLVCALAPVVRASGGRLSDVLRVGGRGSGPTGSRGRAGLIVAEVALSVLLMVGALLMVRSFVRQQSVPPGYRLQGLITADLSLSDPAFEETEDAQFGRAHFVERLIGGVSALEPVTRVAATSSLPASQSHPVATVEAEGRPLALGEEVRVTVQSISTEYLEIFQIPLLEGRSFTASEARDGGAVVLVAESLARRLWGEESALDRRVVYDGVGEDGNLVVVGVTADVTVPRDIVSSDLPSMQLYRPYGSLPRSEVNLVLETDAPLSSLAPQIRDEVRRAGVVAPVSELLPMREVLLRSQWVTRFFSYQMAVYALVGLLIASVGLYGLIADAAQQRQHEMAVRLAMGASPSKVRRLVLGQSVRLVMMGLLLGLPAALVGSRFGATMLLDTNAGDPVVYAGVALLLVAVAVAASWLPARRASLADPVATLRAE